MAYGVALDGDLQSVDDAERAVEVILERSWASVKP